MTYEITNEDVWVGEIADRAGSLGQVLETISAAGANLEFMVARRAPDKPGYGVVFLAPIVGDKPVKAA